MGSDSKLWDAALQAFAEAAETRRERAALEARPYEQDAALSWTVPDGPALPYDGEVPPEVLELARLRRQR